jgi:hypothetical protein
MATARAVTDESGKINSFAVTIGRPISSSELYGDRAKAVRKWKLYRVTTLRELRYSLKSYFSVVAMELIEKNNYFAFEPCRVYQDEENSVFAVHCYIRKTVALVDKKSNYKLQKDADFEYQM